MKTFKAMSCDIVQEHQYLTPWFLSKVQLMYTLEKMIKRNDIRFFHYDNDSQPGCILKLPGEFMKSYTWDQL